LINVPWGQEQSSKIYSSTKLKFYQFFYDFNRRSA
jgi:hypothetical protein